MSDSQVRQIVSSDVQRGNRIPPHQRQTRKWPVLHAGPTPRYLFSRVLTYLTESSEPEAIKLPSSKIETPP